MVRVRRGGERGHFEHGWLKTYYTFSFGDYQDPEHMGFRALRVMNEDWFAPESGFGMHPHRDMEILTYVLEGALSHRDSLGHAGVVARGEWQRMTAGTGIRHSEFNASNEETVHLYQIWVLPDRAGLAPAYEQKCFDPVDGWRLVASPNGAEGSLSIHQDALVLLGRLDERGPLAYTMRPGRHVWLQVARGRVTLDGLALTAGDGVALSEVSGVEVRTEGPEAAEVLLFDMA